MRKINALDQVLTEVNQAYNTLFAKPAGTGRSNPADTINTEKQTELSTQEKHTSAKLMRVNHAGEIAAQGLYRGQAFTAKDPKIKALMAQSALEENDHLNWCEARLQALDSRKSLLNPIWYHGSFTLGALAGLAGDKWSLGFVQETEKQVVKHLEKHANQLPANDGQSQAIIQTMKADEAHHGHVAEQAGAAKLPLPIRKLVMPAMSKVMTTLSARL